MSKMVRATQRTTPSGAAVLSRWILTGLLALLAGCHEGWQEEFALKMGWKKPLEEPQPQSMPTKDPLLGDTIGSQALLGDAADLRVQGFSLVVGLGENGGSGDCPTAIRDYLVEYFNKLYVPERKEEGKPRFSAERLIDSPDVAVVQVTGLVPAGAPRGMAFDLLVEAVPGTQTRSLEGGLLLPCELRLFDPAVGGRGLFAGPVLARAQGPLFTNPFAGDAAGGTGADARRGYVLGGGLLLEARPVKLALVEPSHNLARQIERRVNERFGPSPKAADAQSKGQVALTTPAAFHKRPEQFVQLVTHLYISNQPAFYEHKLRELTELAVKPDAPYERLGLLWEGFGRVAVAQLQPLYGHQNPQISFYAARAGLRLKDTDALPVIAQAAATRGHPHRLTAVRELGLSESPQAAQKLVPLLSDADQEIRIAAYEALAERRHPAIHSRTFRSVLDPDALNLVLDVVDSTGKPLIYVRRTRVPRIAVFGPKTPVALPMFYSDAQDRVTLNAAEGARDITMFCRAKQGRKLSGTILVPPRVADLVAALADQPLKDEAGRLRGVGQNYTQVIQILSALCRDGTIPAQLVLEQASLTDLFGPSVAPPERPESDAPGSKESKEPLLPASAPARPEAAALPPK